MQLHKSVYCGNQILISSFIQTHVVIMLLDRSSASIGADIVINSIEHSELNHTRKTIS